MGQNVFFPVKIQDGGQNSIENIINLEILSLFEWFSCVCILFWVIIDHMIILHYHMVPVPFIFFKMAVLNWPKKMDKTSHEF